MLVDSHCHLYMLEGTNQGEDLTEVMAQAKAHDVHHMLCVGVTLEGFPQVLKIAKANDNIACSVGVHPCDVGDQAVTAATIAELAADTKVVAIGETGLDYFRLEEDDQAAREVQQLSFSNQISAAIQVDKPLIIHTRAAKQDTLAVLRESQADRVGGVMHCFTEDWEMAEAALELNFYISISGIVTFKKADQVKEVAKRVPLDRLLVETDAPYLAPVPFRGKENRPAYVRYVAEAIAELRGISFETLAEQTTENYFNLFKGAARNV